MTKTANYEKKRYSLRGWAAWAKENQSDTSAVAAVAVAAAIVFAGNGLPPDPGLKGKLRHDVVERERLE